MDFKKSIGMLCRLPENPDPVDKVDSRMENGLQRLFLNDKGVCSLESVCPLIHLWNSGENSQDEFYRVLEDCLA